MIHFKVKKSYDEFVKIRNDVIHTGTINDSLINKIKVKLEFEQAIEEFFFAVLDYQGYIWDRKKNDWVQRM